MDKIKKGQKQATDIIILKYLKLLKILILKKLKKSILVI